MASASGSESTRLFGRDRECAAVLGLLDEARASRSGVLVLRGDAGCGKTALLRYGRENVSDSRTVGSAGVQSEIVPFRWSAAAVRAAV